MSDCCAIARARRLNWFGYASLNIFFFGGLLLLGSPIQASLALDFRGSGAVFVVLLLTSCACFVWASVSDPGFARCASPSEMNSVNDTVPADAFDDANAVPRKRNTTGTPTTVATSSANASVSIDMSSLAPVLVDSALPPSGLDASSLVAPDESPALSRRTSDEERASLIPPILIAAPASPAPPLYCAVCRIAKPPRSKHCYECNRCVLRFDHHCPFLGQCVGGRNHYKFWWFLFTQTAVLFWALSDTLQVFSAIKPGDILAYIIVVIFFAFMALTQLVVASLFGYHSYLASANVTTYEFIKSSGSGLDAFHVAAPAPALASADPLSAQLPNSHARSSIYSRASANPYDEGFLRNIITFCCAPIKKEWGSV